MRRLAAALCVLIALASTATARAADSWLMAGHDAHASNDNPGAVFSVSALSGLHVVWSVANVSHAIAADRWVYAVATSQTGYDEVLMLDARTGRLVNTFGPRLLGAQPAPMIADLAYGSGRLIIAERQAVIAFDPFRSRIVWRASFGAGRLVIEREVVYTGDCLSYCRLGVSAAISLRSGRVLWRHAGGLDPVLINGYLYQDWSQPAGTHVLDPATGTEVASLSVTGKWFGDRTHAFAESLSALPARSSLQLIGPTGRPLWKTDIGQVGLSAPPAAYALNTVFTASNRFHPGLIAVNAGNGQLRWAQDLGSNLSFVVAGRDVVVLQPGVGILFLDALKGNTLRRISLPNTSAGSLLVAGRAVYVLNRSGLMALR